MFSILFTFFIICNLKGYYTMKLIHAEKKYLYDFFSCVYYILQKMFFYSDHIVICL